MILWQHFLKFMPRFCHERIVLRPPFPHTRFHSSGTARYRLRVDKSEQKLVIALFTLDPVQYPPRKKVLYRTFETQAEGVTVPSVACFPHQAAEEVVRQNMSPELLLHHIRETRGHHTYFSGIGFLPTFLGSKFLPVMTSSCLMNSLSPIDLPALAWIANASGLPGVDCGESVRLCSRP